MPVESLWSCLRRRELGSRNLVPFRAERFNLFISVLQHFINFGLFGRETNRLTSPRLEPAVPY